MRYDLSCRDSKGEEVLGLVWEDGSLEVRTVTEILEPALARWTEHGIDEWVGTGMDVEPRHTGADDPEFLPRLAEYVRRQSGLEVVLK